MPEYQLNLISASPDCMGEQEARDYAPLWGSYVRAGDSGAVMYGNPADPETAAAMAVHIESDLLPKARALASNPLTAAEYADDPEKLQRLANYCRAVTSESEWDKATPLQRGFIECLFFQAPEDSSEPDGDIHRKGAVSELAPSAWDSVRAICEAFRLAAGDALAQATALPDYTEEQAGRDLCFTVLGAGVGFTDRRQLENRDEWQALGSPRVGDPMWKAWTEKRHDSLAHCLTRAAHDSGHAESLYRGDDGLLYLA